MPPSDPWSSPSTVHGFAAGAPNAALIRYAGETLGHPGRAVDIGCGAGRNAIPLAVLGWHVAGVDRSPPMLAAATHRARDLGVSERCTFVRGTLDRLPVAAGCCQLVVAHGIWNLARSASEFRAGLEEAARVAAPGAGLFVFTFSRSTLGATAHPLAGESFVFSNLSGEANVFLTEQQLVDELAAAGFGPDSALPLEEVNPRRPGMLVAAGSPVIWQGAFRRVSSR